jgi:FAD:protein FMN transferase
MQRLEFRAMGCHMLAVLDSDDAAAIDALTQVPVWLEEWETSLSRFRDDSELSALNHFAGQWMRVSETLWQVIQAARDAARESNDLVTPMLLDALQAAGYDRSFELLEGANVSANVIAPQPAGDWRAIELDTPNRTVRVPHGTRLDFGGVAKGWAADQAARRLAAIAPALVDAGGDIAISRIRANGEPWPIAVADPFNAESDLELLMIDQGGVATSGRDFRKWQQDGKWQHHIIDPRTGAPAETDVLAVTVIAPTTLAAEIAAKVALILGSQNGLQWIEARSELAGLLVLENGQVLRTRRLDGYVREESVVAYGDTILPSWS